MVNTATAKQEWWKAFGARLREMRKLAGLNQRDLAEGAGMDFTYLSKIENGNMAPPSEDLLQSLIAALQAKGVSVNRLEMHRLARRIPEDIQIALWSTPNVYELVQRVEVLSGNEIGQLIETAAEMYDRKD